jgi:peptidoglycan/xylan/chitin deacetylase (PgdA/CDA1 family)
MRAAGMAIESHTHSHPFLSELSEGELRDELRRSRDLLGENLGEAPSMIALPGGDRPRDGFDGIIAEEGYRVVANSRWGLNRVRAGETIRLVRRCTVRGEMHPLVYLSALRGDAWLASRKRTRELTLAGLRRSLGPSRYARWRRGLLDFAGAWLTA